MKTIGERIKYVQKSSDKNQVDFARSLGVSKGSLILYQKNERSPDSSFLKTLCVIYKVNPSWLLLGEGGAYWGAENKTGEKEGKAVNVDPVLQLLNEEEEHAGIALTPEQRIAILKILRELVDRDVRSIRELLSSIQIGRKEQKNGKGQD